MKPRGGIRPGAGPKPGPPKVRLTTSFLASTVAEIRRHAPHSTPQAGVRGLVEWALAKLRSAP